MLDRSEVGKRGYLDRDFRLVHLKDSLAPRIDYHYHEFDKLVFFLGGRVTYVVEGVTYFLRPWDILLIQHNLIHRPIIDASEPYERVVLWLGLPTNYLKLLTALVVAMFLAVPHWKSQLFTARSARKGEKQNA